MKISEVYAIKSACPVSLRVWIMGILLVWLAAIPAGAQEYCTIVPAPGVVTGSYGGNMICALYDEKKSVLS